MKKQTWVIYRHINKVNGKSYIGQTKRNIGVRWNNGDGYKNQVLFYTAIQKYGWENFDHQILKSNIKSQKKADYFEKKYIKKYHTYVYDKKCNGYNANTGGDARGNQILWRRSELRRLRRVYFRIYKPIKTRKDALIKALPDKTYDEILRKLRELGWTREYSCKWRVIQDAGYTGIKAWWYLHRKSKVETIEFRDKDDYNQYLMDNNIYSGQL